MTAMIPFNGGVLTAFSNASGNPTLHRIHWSQDGSNPGGGPVVYEGVSPVTAMVPHAGGVCRSGDPHVRRAAGERPWTIAA